MEWKDILPEARFIPILLHMEMAIHAKYYVLLLNICSFIEWMFIYWNLEILEVSTPTHADIKII